MELNDITEQVIGSAIEVHRAIGPGLLESAGLIINFNVPVLKSGIKRVVNNFQEASARSAALR